jgi:DHA1 family bicyclomycin/chloramphenicol resistance-like MFS transporter
LGNTSLFVSLNFKETLSQAEGQKKKLSKHFNMFKTVLKRKFLFSQLYRWLSLWQFICIYSASPFIIQKHYHFTPLEFSLFFAVNAIALGAEPQYPPDLKTHERSLIISNSGMIICSVFLLFVLSNNLSIILLNRHC